MSTLFFHFDGTDNSPNDAYAPEHSVSSITNVLKSHRLLGGRINNHRSFYYAGIGTYGHWLEKIHYHTLATNTPPDGCRWVLLWDKVIFLIITEGFVCWILSITVR